MYLSGGLTSSLTKGLTSAVSKGAASSFSKAAGSASKGFLSTATKSATRAAAGALSKGATSALTKGATQAARSGLFSSLSQGARTIASGAGSVLSKAIELAPAAAELYYAIKGPGEMPLLPDDATVAPMQPGQPMPGEPGTVMQPALVQPTQGQATSTGPSQGTQLLPALNVGGVNVAPYLLIGGAALLAFALLNSRSERKR